MKKIIKWLSDISGVTKDIETEHCKSIGHSMYDYSYWFTGGLQHGNGIYEVSNAFVMYSMSLKNGNPNLIGSEHNRLRSEIYRLKDDNLLIHNMSK